MYTLAVDSKIDLSVVHLLNTTCGPTTNFIKHYLTNYNIKFVFSLLDIFMALIYTVVFFSLLMLRIL